jgi:F-type H+-transporting ATPase subunit epsilon
VVLDREVSYVQAEDPTGRFGVLPGHERYLTAVVPSILVYRCGKQGENESYVAVREGVLRVTEEGVEVAVREAFPGDDLGTLRDTIREAREKRQRRSYGSSRSVYQMQLAAWRRLVEFSDARAQS